MTELELFVLSRLFKEYGIDFSSFVYAVKFKTRYHIRHGVKFAGRVVKDSRTAMRIFSNLQYKNKGC